ALDVLVVSIDDEPGPDLQRVASRHGWLQLHCPSLRQAMRQVMTLQPRVVIVQVAAVSDSALQLVRMLQAGWRKVALIVTSRLHSDDLEREARIAGATAYLPEGEAEAVVDQYVDQILQPAISGAGMDLSRRADLNSTRLDHGHQS